MPMFTKPIPQPAHDAALTADLPLRADLGETTPAKGNSDSSRDINETTGGKITNGLINYVVGFVGNSGMSLGITYLVNPHPAIKSAKDAMSSGIAKLLRAQSPVAHKRIQDSARSSIEILCMMISGTIATAMMTPLVIYRQNIAYGINKMLGKDTDVLPDDMKVITPPTTLEEKIEQEVAKRVKSKHNGLDLWKARFVSMGIILAGDAALNQMNRSLEDHNRQSLDTYAWRLGQHIHNVLPEKGMSKWRKWFDSHGAGMNDIRENMKDHFGRLEETEFKYGNSHNGVLNENSAVIAEQTRLVGKEVGGTLAIAVLIDKLTSKFRDMRVDKQHAKVLQQLKKEGIIPAGYDVAISRDGNVVLNAPHPLAPAKQNGLEAQALPETGATSHWTQMASSQKPRPVPQENFAGAVDKSRAEGPQLAY